jgi:hypothetical protein
MHTRTLLAIGVVAALAGAPAANAQDISRTDPLPVAGETTSAVEQEAGDLVRHCVERMATITRNTCERINRAGWEGAARLRMLAQQGAPDGVLVESARESLERMRGIADEGRDRVNRTARECLDRLKAMEASPAHARVVLTARDRSLTIIGHCLREGAERVRRALGHFTGDAAPTSPIAG